MKKSFATALLVGTMAATPAPDAEAGRYSGAWKTGKEHALELFGKFGQACERQTKACENVWDDLVGNSNTDNPDSSAEPAPNRVPTAPIEKPAEKYDGVPGLDF